MADVKISALPAATTPLAGTELVPLVQSSTTKSASASAVGTSGNTAPAVNQQTGTSYHPVLSDAPQSACYQGVIEMNNGSANSVTIDPHNTSAWVVGTTFQVIQTGAGQTSIVAGSGVTINNASSLNARAQYSILVLVNVATDVWRLGGDMA